MQAGQASATSEPAPPLTHYFTEGERIADRWVHIAGLVLASLSGVLMIALSAASGGAGQTGAVSVYSACLVIMLAASAAYNLARRQALQQRLRKLDHAAIFLMIAGSYTPFTTQCLEGAWSFVATLFVWAVALAAAAGKIFLRDVPKKIWVAVYLMLGWMVLGAYKPLVHGVAPVALMLLVAGGVIYSLGVFVYAARALPFRRAIWHAFVVVAAGTHYAAIVTGVVLA